MSAGLGILTPFYFCSAEPLFIGFVSAGVPLGVMFSFLIAAPMVNEVALVLLVGLVGRPDAFNPAELLLASLAACVNKGAERMSPMIKFDLRGLEITLHGRRQDSPPKMVAITYDLIVDTSESDERIDLLHKNVRKYGTISNYSGRRF